MRKSRFTQIAAGATVVLAAACNSDTTGPASLSNPQATISAVAALDSTFGSSVLASFGVLSGSIGSTHAAAALARAGTIVQATLPRPAGSAMSAEAAAVRRLSGLRPLALVNPQGPVIPDSLYGSVYTYDTVSASYTRSATTGGPANGVRFILYAVNPFTNGVAIPRTPVGRADLLDESAGSTAQLHIIVSGNGGTPTYLDYTAGLTFGPATLTATLKGSLTNALPGGGNKTLTFNVTADFTATTITVHATYTLNNPAVTIVLAATDVQALPRDSVNLAFGFTRQSETVGFTGFLVTTSGDVDTVSAAITVNGQPYASIKGNNLGVTFYDAADNPISDTTHQHDILLALESIQYAVVLVIGFTAALFDPIVNLLGS